MGQIPFSMRSGDIQIVLLGFVKFEHGSDPFGQFKVFGSGRKTSTNGKPPRRPQNLTPFN